MGAVSAGNHAGPPVPAAAVSSHPSHARLATVMNAPRPTPIQSGGMVWRTSLACALVHDPDILFLDEPTVGLDPELRATMWEGFRRRRDDGALVVVSTHYLGEVDRCDRVLSLSEGGVLALDSPAGLRERTNTESLEDAFLTLVAADREDGTKPGRATVMASNGGGES